MFLFNKNSANWGLDMQILTARYITEGVTKVVTLHAITKKNYGAVYKGKLFCPTEHCPAKVAFCSGHRAHYKTWRFSNHAPDCMYHLDRSGRRSVTGFKQGITVNVSKKRKQEAVMRAYKSMLLLEVDGTMNMSSKNRNKKNKSPKKAIADKRQSIQLRLFDGETDEEGSKIKSKKLISRFVDEIGPSDSGQSRIIKGYVKDIKLMESVAEITVGHNTKEIKIVFEERFKEEPLNKSYLSKFWAIKELLGNQKTIIFTGAGDVHRVGVDDYELSVFMGADFKLNGEDLYNIARRMKSVLARKSLEAI